MGKLFLLLPVFLVMKTSPLIYKNFVDIFSSKKRLYYTTKKAVDFSEERAAAEAQAEAAAQAALKSE